MKIDVIRARDGKLIGIAETDAVQSDEGAVEGGFDPEDGQQIESMEVRRSDTFDLDALAKRLSR